MHLACAVLVTLGAQVPLAFWKPSLPLPLPVHVLGRTALASLLAWAACPSTSSPPASCRVTKRGSSGAFLLTGTLLTSDGALDDGSMLIEGTHIACVGKGCGLEPAARDATAVVCTDAVVSPGFVNPHEHIEYGNFSPYADAGTRCDHRHDWRLGMRNTAMRPAQINGSRLDATRLGELRHLLSGTTAIVGGAMVPGLVRNLDYVAGLEDGLVAPVASWDVFPLDDSRGIQRVGDCDYGPAAIGQERAGKLYRYMAHVSEGLDAEAANEFACLSSETFDRTPMAGGGGMSADIVASNVALVHALGLTEADFDLVAARGAHVVWSPRSNVFLYGATLNISYLLEAGINVALGTDWLPSGSATMAREAICAASVMQASHGVRLDPKTIWEMMTINAARAAGFEAHLGALAPGKLADVAIFGGQAAAADAFATAAFASGEHVELVMRGGRVVLAGAGLEDLAQGPACESVAWNAGTKRLCVRGDLGTTYAEFAASLRGAYPAILPGVPPDEPLCAPTR